MKNRPNILVLGDIILDQYVTGIVQRNAPEAPVPVVEKRKTRFELGGAANVACKVKELGGAPILIGIVGKDAAGKKIKALLQNAGVDARYVIPTDRPTTVKTRVYSDEQMLLRLDTETRKPITHKIERVIKEAVQKINFSAVVISDYNLGLITRNVMESVFGTAKDAPILIDPKGRDWSRYSAPQKARMILTPNINELKTFGGNAKDALQATRARAVALTRGKRGITLYTQNTSLPFPAKEVLSRDVTGAGDAVAAAIGVRLAEEYHLPRAVKCANIAGAKVVTQRGVGKLNKVIFTNGCFDLLHLGHIKFLKAARNLGDKLIVGLNSDTSVSALKGSSRPVQNQAIRKKMLMELPWVDEVKIFYEHTPVRLIKDICPDVLVKGAEYKDKEIAGAKFVKSYGGEIVLIPREVNISTTEIIKCI